MTMLSIADLPWLPPAPADFRQRLKRAEAEAAPGPALRDLAGMMLNANHATSLARSIDRLVASGADCAPLLPVTLGLVANGTTDLITPAIIAAGLRHGLLIRMVVADYDQAFQAATDPDSAVNRAGPDLVLLALDHRGLGLGAGPDAAARALDYLDTLRGNLGRHGGAPVIVQTVARPPEPLFGHLDLCEPTTLRAQAAAFNDGLVRRLGGGTDYLLDVAALAETVGLAQWHDCGQYFLARLPFAQALVPLYAEHVARLVAAIRGRARKCLVLDLDNTTWGGIIGDDGLDGIVIGQGNPLGEAHLEVQRLSMALRARGVVLAVCSKNEDATARLPFRQHADMLLREEHIAVFQANWSDKASNLEAIARSLDIGLDALVLLDDNPAERAQVRAALPMVAVPELPADPAQFARILAFAGYFETVAFSAEDQMRAGQYQANAQRAQLREGSRDLGDYLASLEMTISHAPFDPAGRGRVAQLINKSNQFNLTTRRYTEAELAVLEADPAIFTLQVRLVDRFGDNGMIGVAICRPVAEDWEIDTWLMSCRVLGRKVEQAMLNEIATAARAVGAKGLLGRFIPSQRNEMVRRHYATLGFAKLSEDESGASLWRLELKGWQQSELPMLVAHAVSRGES